MPYADPAAKADWARRYHAMHRAEVNRNKREWAARNVRARAAHVVVGNAVRDGRLLRGACERAGAGCVGEVEAHHDDYSKPMEVRWLCDRHHKDVHKEARAA